VYAVTAHILRLNGIIGDNDVMDAKTLPQVKCPTGTDSLICSEQILKFSAPGFRVLSRECDGPAQLCGGFGAGTCRAQAPLEPGLFRAMTDFTGRIIKAGQYAGRILKGEKPADLPVVQRRNSTW